MAFTGELDEYLLSNGVSRKTLNNMPIYRKFEMRERYKKLNALYVYSVPDFPKVPTHAIVVNK